MFSTFKELIEARSPEERRLLAHSKRFLERWTGDATVREAVMADEMEIGQIAADCGADIDPWSLQPIFHPRFVSYRENATAEEWPLARLWDDHIREMLLMRTGVLMSGGTQGTTPIFDAWRGRQIVRAQLELGVAAAGLVHPPISFELSVGCSVGCWFCGISAKDFGGNYLVSEHGLEEWRETLLESQKILGDGLKAGFLYWATEPLDNPDYPKFLQEFIDITGTVPQTTTAIAMRDPAFTREVLRVSEGYWNVPNRFSVLTTPLLKRIHKEFTPEELLSVEMVLQMEGATGHKSFVGRAAEKVSEGDQKADRRKAQLDMENDATIACVSGFLVNIVQKKIRLVSPCSPSPENPDGYITIAETRYATPRKMGEVMQSMIADHMDIRLDPNLPLHFVEGYSYLAMDDRHIVQAKAIAMESDLLEVIGAPLMEGNKSPVEVVMHAAREGKDPIAVVSIIEQFHKAGVIAQAREPEFANTI